MHKPSKPDKTENLLYSINHNLQEAKRAVDALNEEIRQLYNRTTTIANKNEKTSKRMERFAKYTLWVSIIALAVALISLFCR